MSEQFRKQLSDWKKENKKNQPGGNKKDENNMSTRYIQQLMGVDRPVYRKYKGSFRQR